ncbi:MAG: hypothetical protein HY774_12085 [Acidobacteria bacterium]|nr:hypothetical protein [Acidobacteriota bacterium]
MYLRFMLRLFAILWVLGSGVICLAAPQSVKTRFAAQGTTQVFHLKIPLSDIAPNSAWDITARASDGTAFAIAVDRPLPAQVSTEWTSPEHQKQYEAYQERLNQVSIKMNQVNEQISTLEPQQKALADLLKDTTIKAETRAVLQAKLNRVEAEHKALTKKRSDLEAEMARVQETAPTIDWNAKPESKPDPQWLDVYGRLSGSEPTSVILATLPKSGEPARVVATLKLSPPQKFPADTELVKQWATAWTNQLGLELVNGGDPWMHLQLIRQTVEKYQIPMPDFSGFLRLQRRDGGNRFREEVDLFSITTGGLAIQESLQYRQLLNISDDRGGQTVPITKLEGPAVKSHPFEKMLEGRQPVVFELAKLVPHDQYYVHFSTIKSEIELSDLLDQWGTTLLQSIEVTSHDRQVKERLLKQLCIELSSLTRLFGSFVVDDLALTGNDPFVTDGNDLSVIFNVKNGPIFDQSMAAHRAEAKKQRPDAVESTARYGNFEIGTLTTPDREISSYWTTVDSYRVYSNSRSALERILDAAQGKRPSLKAAAEFRYMRTIFPGTVNDEDGFLYLSDAFIRRVVGAEQKIGRIRQLGCTANLHNLEHAHLSHGYDQGKRTPVTLTELREQKLLDADDLECPSGGTYQLDEQGLARCSVHGSHRNLTPLIEIPITQATPAEAAGYRNFVERYTQYWSRYFDPVGIRFRLRDKIEVETCILPLIENSIYNGVRESAGGRPAKLSIPVTAGTIASVGMKLGEESPLRKEMLKSFLLDMTGPDSEKFLATIGDTISLNFCDGTPLFTFAMDTTTTLIGGSGLPRGDDAFFGLILSSLTLPIYVSMDITDAAQAERLFDKVLAQAEQRFRMQGERWLTLERYELNSYRDIPIHTAKLSLFVADFRFAWAIVGKHLIVSTQLPVLTSLIDALKDKPDTALLAHDTPSNLLFSMRPSQFRQIRPTVAAHWQEKMRGTCLQNLSGIRLLNEQFPITNPDFHQQFLKRMGYIPFCPAGGSYQIEPTSGVAECTVHGTHSHPKQPIEATGKEPFIQFVESLKGVQASLEFTPEGIHTRITLDRTK